MSFPETLLFLGLGSLLAWAPIFAFAYWRRQFGGSARNYLIAYLATSFASVAILLLMALAESAGR
jgi:hypothetical protein